MGPPNGEPSLRPWRRIPTSEAAGSQQRCDRHDESWVEISSQPSSSSLSSIGDEVIPTGLLFGSFLSDPRQRRLGHNQRRQVEQQRQAAPATQSSSQDEYEETESEDDSFLASSGENISIPSTPFRHVTHPDTEMDGDGDENVAALGRRYLDSPPSFRPQPNAFSHPPVAPAFLSDHPHSAVRGGSRSVRNLPNQRSGGPSFMGVGGHQPDNDAALRASLTTLLSCAAAARGIPKDRKEAEGLPVRPGGRVTPGNQPMGLRLVQEAELLGSSSPGLAPSTTFQRQGGCKSVSSDDRSKRRCKKKRFAVTSEEALINPTLLTWAVSAGVVILASVVGFGAGYVIGREVGKNEGMNAAASSFNTSSMRNIAAGCGKEAIRGSPGGTLTRFRWGTDIARSIAA